MTVNKPTSLGSAASYQPSSMAPVWCSRVTVLHAKQQFNLADTPLEASPCHCMRLFLDITGVMKSLDTALRNCATEAYGGCT